MCEPTTIAAVATGLQIAGTVTSTYGAYQRSKAEKQAYEYQSAVARNNAMISEQQAQDALQRGQTAEARQRMKTAQLKGAQRASLAARGISLDEGSALNILDDTDYFGELDALAVRENAAREAYGYRVQGSNYSSNAAMMRARADMESPYGAAFTSLLTGSGAVADSWYKRSSSGTSTQGGGKK
jgi:hypothetical protein